MLKKKVCFIVLILFKTKTITKNMKAFLQEKACYFLRVLIKSAQCFMRYFATKLTECNVGYVHTSGPNVRTGFVLLCGCPHILMWPPSDSRGNSSVDVTHVHRRWCGVYRMLLVSMLIVKLWNNYMIIILTWHACLVQFLHLNLPLTSFSSAALY